jgi:BlaI family penicillinase repressor
MANTGLKKSCSAELSEAEWDIMRVVWDQEPCAAGTVQDALEGSRQWAYSTVKTMMDRMAVKDLLKITKIRNLQLFSSKITQTQAKQGELKRMLKRAFDGALTPLVQFLVEQDEFSKEDISQLREVVTKAEKGN